MSTRQLEVSNRFQRLQDKICRALEDLDGKAKFVEDQWSRPGGGGGKTRIIQEGDLIEKGGVNFSAVHGELPEKIKSALKLPDEAGQFFATGVSIVLHPDSPLMPIIHMNIRYFEMTNGTWWFGGGIDLTPHYIVPQDAHIFHRFLKETCDRHHWAYYPAFKKWADDYFYINHRKETRGIGGIFFDRLSDQEGFDFDARFKFVVDVGKTFVPIYKYFTSLYKTADFTPEQIDWQMLRRSRYVEFNLVYDKGTKFGLDTDGRTESILMSLPPQAAWVYNHQAPIDSDEQQTLDLLKKGIDWVSYKEKETVDMDPDWV